MLSQTQRVSIPLKQKKGTIKAPCENLNEPKKPNANNEALNENTACYRKN